MRLQDIAGIMHEPYACRSRIGPVDLARMFMPEITKVPRNGSELRKNGRREPWEAARKGDIVLQQNHIRLPPVYRLVQTVQVRIEAAASPRTWEPGSIRESSRRKELYAPNSNGPAYPGEFLADPPQPVVALRKVN